MNDNQETISSVRRPAGWRLPPRWAMLLLLAAAVLATAFASESRGDISVARVWNEAMLDAIRIDFPAPTVHARNLFHTSAAMFDAWAAYDDSAVQYFHNETAVATDSLDARNEAISYAAYNVLKHRYAQSVNAPTTLMHLDETMDRLGYDKNFTSTVGNSPAALGNRIAQTVINHGLQDGANEQHGYADTTGYQPVNQPLIVSVPAGITMNDPNRWQPLAFDVRITQNGLEADLIQSFIGAHWGNVTPFALHRDNPASIYMDPGPPPMLGTATDAEYKARAMDIIRYSSLLDPDTADQIEIGPAGSGNNPVGTNAGSGYAVNPFTAQPYAPNVANHADYGRVIAEYWADGPSSETPPGHWNVLANQVSESSELQKRIGGVGPVVDDLEWDVKMYFALNGATHDAAIAAWDCKAKYDYVRPISMIRYMGSKGQSSDPNGPSYDPEGLPLEPGLVEVIEANIVDPEHRHYNLRNFAGEVAILAWAGEPLDTEDEYSGSEWILAERWLPYQRDTFVTPSFAAYTSGHSTFSRAAAEVLARFTGSEYFPGGLGEVVFAAGDYLEFEDGPSEELRLQWATYFDAADEAGLSRLYGGIHVAADDLNGRLAGSAIGISAFDVAWQYIGSVPEPSSMVLALALAAACGLRRCGQNRG